MTERKEPIIGMWDRNDLIPEPPKAELRIINEGQQNNGFVVIALSIIISAMIMVGGWIAYIEYKSFQEKRDYRLAVEAAERQADAAKRRLELERQRAVEIRNSQRRSRVAREDSMTRAINNARLEASQNCQFWRQQHETNPTERTKTEVAKNCALK